MSRTVTLEDIAASVRALGFTTNIERMGSGVAALFVGPEIGTDSDGNSRYLAVVSPAKFTGTFSEAEWEGLTVGPDTEDGWSALSWGNMANDPNAVAELIDAHACEWRLRVEQFCDVVTYVPAQFDMEDLCAALEFRGVPAFVAQTGGGCATIFAGPRIGRHAAPDYGLYVCAIGPGSYGWGQGPSLADYGDLYIGPGTPDGETAVNWDLRPWSVAYIAEYVVRMLPTWREHVETYLGTP